MADTTKSIYQLKAQLSFEDGDTRVITLENPRTGLTQADITALNELAAQVFVGDKTGATCIGITAAKYVEGTEITLDI